MAKVMEDRALGEDVDLRRAHGADHLVVHDRILRFDIEPLERRRVRFEGERVAGVGFERRLIPPQPDEADAADPAAVRLERRDQRFLDVAPAPPVMAEVENVVLLVGRGDGRRLERRIVAIERQRHFARTCRRRDGRLVDAVGERVEMLEPAGALSLGVVVAVVAVEAEDGVIHPVHVEDQAVSAWPRGQHRRFAHAAQAIDFGFEQIDDFVGRADPIGEAQAGQPRHRPPVKADLVPELRRDAHVVGDRMCVPRIAPVLHDEEDLHRDVRVAIAASSSSRRA